MTDEPIHLFAYGTLMPGYGNFGRIEHLVRSARAATTTGVLRDLGAYPAMVRGEGVVRGVVLEVEEAALAITDHIEGYVPGRERNLYVREEVSVDLDGSESLRAWTYFYCAADVIADQPKLIIGKCDGRPICAWNPCDSQSLPNDPPNESIS